MNVSQCVANVRLRAYHLIGSALRIALRLMSSDSQKFRMQLLCWVAGFSLWFDGMRPTLGDIDRRFGKRDRPDGTHRAGPARTTLRYHLSTMVSDGLLYNDGSTYWVTARGAEIAASERFAG